MSTRPFTDITTSIGSNPIKNGTLLVQSRITGFNNHDTYNAYVSNSPTISDIDDKYGYRFWNGIFINSVDGGQA